jgi:hypothetical protein
MSRPSHSSNAPASEPRRGVQTEPRHLSTAIDRSAGEVYEYTSDPGNLPQWAAGLSSGIEPDGERWVTESPMGRVYVQFAAPNRYGVLDHDVTLPSGETVYNPMRVIADGSSRCDVVFTLRRRAGMSDEELERDAAAILADLARLKQLLESG